MVWYGECGHRPLQLVSPPAFCHDNGPPLTCCRKSGAARAACQTSVRGRGGRRAGGGISSRGGKNCGEFRETAGSGPSSRLGAYSARWGGFGHVGYDSLCPACPHAECSYDGRSHGESDGDDCTCHIAPHHRRATPRGLAFSWSHPLCFQYWRRRRDRSATPGGLHASDRKRAAPADSRHVAACRPECQQSTCGAKRQQSACRPKPHACGYAVACIWPLHRSCRLPGILQPSGSAHRK